MTADLGRVEATLADYAALTRTAMAESLVDGEPAEYLYDLVRDYPRRSGKAIRPALLLATCQAYGGSVRDGLAAAVAVEMLHNAFLIHDDIEDASARRRGQPTLHELHGIGLAINAGDALAALALQPLQRDDLLGARLSRQLVSEFALAVRLTTEGQALELGWRRDNVVDIGPADYLGLAGKKTSWYTTVAPLRMGALIGSRGVASLPALSRFGFYLGAAFQVQDDLLSTAGPDAVHGKDPLGDIREGKRTLMLVHLLAEATGSHHSFLVDYLGTPQEDRTPAGGRRVLALMKRYGSLEFAREYGSGIIAAACDAFAPAFAEAAPSEHLEFIRGLIPYMLARSA